MNPINFFISIYIMMQWAYILELFSRTKWLTTGVSIGIDVLLVFFISSIIVFSFSFYKYIENKKYLYLIFFILIGCGLAGVSLMVLMGFLKDKTLW